MLTYYTIVHADTKRRVEWSPGKPGYGWPNQPHLILAKIERLEADFEDDNKLVMRQVVGGARPQVSYLTLAEAKQRIPAEAEAFVAANPDRVHPTTQKALDHFHRRSVKAAIPIVPMPESGPDYTVEEDLF